MSIDIQNRTRQRHPAFSYDELAEKVLGKNYELSLVFVGNTVSRRLNKTLRGKDKPTNVLSFPLSKTSGEIFIDLAKAKQENKKFGMNFKKFVIYLFIHGLLHLKGMEHGDKMIKVENQLLNKWQDKLS